MTERLYFTNSHLTEFESEVVACVPAADRFEVTLAATAFYPTGGGQPYDTGTLGERAVLDVVDRDDAGIVHIVDGPLEAGVRVRGIVDKKRRLDHMQQHSGQHMLSAAFDSVCGARTESFHLGTETSTIDLSRVVSPAEISAAEDAVNRIVWEDREVRLRFASPEEAAALPLRKETGREGMLRLIEVDGFDLSACGGTHVTRTGVVGIISVLSWEKFKGGMRIEFVCGKRALHRLREWRDVFSATSRILSVLPSALAPAIERLQGENKTLGKTLREQQEQLAVHEAAKLVAAGARGADGRIIVVQALEGWDAQGLKIIASAAAATPGVCMAVFSTTAPTLVVVSRAADVRVDSGAVVKALIAKFGGKGGGKPEMAQAGGLTGNLAEIIQVASALLGPS
ncbi:MAG: DHHA1 domain-containing protein [Vicinamibacteria bacterium]